MQKDDIRYERDDLQPFFENRWTLAFREMNFWEFSEKILIRKDQQNVIYSWAESFYNVNFACRVVLNSFSVINQWLEGWNIMGKRLSQDYSLCINKDTVLYSTHNKRQSIRQGRSSRKKTIPTNPIVVCFRRDRLLLAKRSSAFVGIVCLWPNRWFLYRGTVWVWGE